jgi:two-component system, NarL family, sensor kinase
MRAALLSNRSSIWILCGLIFSLELIAPTEYVFGHLYIAPLLLSSFKFGQKGISIVMRVCISLALLDVIIPHNIDLLNSVNAWELSPNILVNRLNVIVVLIMTTCLLKRNLQYVDEIALQKEEITSHKAELLTQLGLAQMREDFVHTLTHDLKTPLLGALQTIKSFQEEQFGVVSIIQSKVLTMMSQSQQRSLRLVETLLDVYRNDADGLVLHREKIDLGTIAQESIDTMLILASERELKLNLDCDRLSIVADLIIGDRLQLSRVFSNLLSNAIYHSPRGEEIRIAIHRRSDEYIITVSDRGKGIEVTNLPLLFDRFYQAEDRVQGSGLGLYLSRQIVEAHGGKIWAEPALPQGTNFYFSLPIGV